MEIYNSGFSDGYGHGWTDSKAGVRPEKNIDCTHSGCNRKFSNQSFLDIHIASKHAIIKIDDPSCTVSEHAYGRAKERMGWGRETIERMAQKAFCNGISAEHNRMPIKGFNVDHSKIKSFIYGENIYLFSSKNLVTFYRILPSMIEHMKSVKKQLNKGI